MSDDGRVKQETHAYAVRYAERLLAENERLRGEIKDTHKETQSLRNLLKEARSYYNDGYFDGWPDELVRRIDAAITVKNKFV